MLTARMHDSVLVAASGGCTAVRGLDALSAVHNTKAISRAPCAVRRQDGDLRPAQTVTERIVISAAFVALFHARQLQPLDAGDFDVVGRDLRFDNSGCASIREYFFDEDE